MLALLKIIFKGWTGWQEQEFLGDMFHPFVHSKLERHYQTYTVSYCTVEILSERTRDEFTARGYFSKRCITVIHHEGVGLGNVEHSPW